jgi:hypothetical protein
MLAKSNQANTVLLTTWSHEKSGKKFQIQSPDPHSKHVLVEEFVISPSRHELCKANNTIQTHHPHQACPWHNCNEAVIVVVAVTSPGSQSKLPWATQKRDQLLQAGSS